MVDALACYLTQAQGLLRFTRTEFHLSRKFDIYMQFYPK